MTKSFFVLVTLVIALSFTQKTWAQCPPNVPGTAINNGINGDGYWEICVRAGGETRTGNIDPFRPSNND